MSQVYDFGGYATKNDLKCADGRTIRKNAFIDCDGMTVPLVWGHKHGSPGDVLGHAVLENREDGVYTYGTFNDTPSGQNARELVRHGDVKALSIYANNLVQRAGDVLHGMIREVSLCLSGANPGARIEELSFEHAADDDSEDFEALVFNGENIELAHSDDEYYEEGEPTIEDVIHSMNEEQQNVLYYLVGMALEDNSETVAHSDDATVQEVLDSLTEQQKNVVYFLIGQALEQAENNIKHSDDERGENDMAEKTVADVFDELTEEQKNVVYFMIGQAIEQNEEENQMSHNAFENDNYLAHAMIDDAMQTVLADGKKYGTLRDSYEHHMEDGGALAHAIDTTGMDVPVGDVTYGVNGVDYLYPQARALNNIPEFIKRDTDWVDVVLDSVHTSPFARVKSIFANITEDDARAKGYLKGTMKKNEFFSLMKRETLPQTIYKKQKFDRDDVVDITDMNVVAWIKGEMNDMLDEEKARAILVGDGREVSDPDKIKPDCIRPIAFDVPLFTIKGYVTEGQDDEATAKNMIKANLRARKDYRGSGNPIMFTTEDWLTSMLLIEDQIGRRLYATEAELAAACRVSKIVTVPVMEGITDSSNRDLMAVIVNLKDYNVGADKGGEVNMFDDFNIDYNQFIYLIETRCSGALTKPYSAIALFKGSANPSQAGE